VIIAGICFCLIAQGNQRFLQPSFKKLTAFELSRTSSNKIRGRFILDKPFSKPLKSAFIYTQILL